MKSSAVSSPRASGVCRRVARLSPVAAAVSSLLLGAIAAQAQQTDKAGADAAQTVTITGIRHAIETSVATKRNADSIVEAVSAEDIGKLPDVSIAESLARLPGLAAQRVDGRAQVISIRGLAPRYGATLLNGREMVSTGDNRSVEYDQFPSELMNSATVYKTPDATLVGQGLSGTVNMQTVRPLDFRGRQMVFNGRVEHNGNGSLNSEISANGNRVSASYIDQFANNTLGVALGFAHLDSPGQEKHYKSWWWADTGAWGSPLAGTPAGSVALQGFEAGVASTTHKRDGLMAAIEYRPRKDLRTMVDLYYSKFDQNEVRRTFMSSLSTWDGVSYSNATTSKVHGDTIVTGGNILGAKPVDLTTSNVRHDTVKAVGWNTEYTTGAWKLGADLSYSKAKRNETNAELQAGASGPVNFNNVSIATGDGRSQLTPATDFASAAAIQLRDPAGWGRDGRSQFPKVDDELKSLRLNIRRDLGCVFSTFDGGLNYSDRTKSMNRTEVYYNLKNGRAPVSVLANLLSSPTSLDFAGVSGGLMSFNFPGVLGQFYNVSPAAQDQAPGRIWSVQEKVTTAFAKLGIDIDGRIPVRGNLGLQVVRADQSSAGLAWNGTTNSAVPVTGGKTYTDVLPSVNLVFDVMKDTYVRLGIAKVLARPNMEDMRAGFSGISVSQNPPQVWSANGGNPGLEPWRAEAYDLSAEKYFGKRSYVAAAVFKKHLKSFVYNQSIKYDFTGFPNPTPYTPVSNIGTLSTMANGHGGYIEGLELSASLEGNLVSQALDGFGLQLSASKTHSSLHEGNNVDKPLDGMSGKVTSVTAYYEKYGFSARVSQRYRSKFETTVRGTFGDNVASAILPERITDLQLGYAFESGSLKGLSLLLQVNNLNDTPYRTSVGISAGASDPKAVLPERYTTYGRQILFGVNYKL